MKKSLLFVAATLFAAVGSAPVSAQDGTFGMDSLDQAAFSNALITRSQIIHKTGGALDPLSVRDRYIKRGGKGGGKAGTRTSRPTPRVTTRFRTSLAGRRAVLARLVAQTRAIDPAGATRLQNFLGGDPIAPLKPTLSRYGLRADDTADAMALYLVVAWYGSRGLDKDPPQHLMRAVRTQMRNTLPTLPAFSKASNAVKQQMADSMWIQTIVAASSINAAKGKPALMNQTKSAIRQGAMKAFKIDITKVKLTSQGLRA